MCCINFICFFFFDFSGFSITFSSRPINLYPKMAVVIIAPDCYKFLVHRFPGVERGGGWNDCCPSSVIGGSSCGNGGKNLLLLLLLSLLLTFLNALIHNLISKVLTVGALLNDLLKISFFPTSISQTKEQITGFCASKVEVSLKSNSIDF